MISDRIQELAILYAVGALEGDEAKEFSALIEQEDEATRSELAAWNNATLAITSMVQPVQHPSTSVKEKLMRNIQKRHATERSIEGPGTPRVDHARGIYSVHPEKMEWSKHPVKGVQFKVLTESARRGYITMLMKVEPGVEFPEHHHSGEEECYVLSGSIILNGRRIGQGVLHHGDEDSEHGTLTSEEGALLLLVVAKEDYIPPVD